MAYSSTKKKKIRKKQNCNNNEIELKTTQNEKQSKKAKSSTSFKMFNKKILCVDHTVIRAFLSSSDGLNTSSYKSIWST